MHIEHNNGCVKISSKLINTCNKSDLLCTRSECLDMNIKKKIFEMGVLQGGIFWNPRCKVSHSTKYKQFQLVLLCQFIRKKYTNLMGLNE